MLSLLVALIVLALVFWGIKLLLAALGAPGWLLQIATVIAVIIGVIMIANAFGIATPNLK